MPRIQPIPTLPEQVADQLRRRLAAGEFPIGSLLPPETQLAQELGVVRVQPDVAEHFLEEPVHFACAVCCCGAGSSSLRTTATDDRGAAL